MIHKPAIVILENLKEIFSMKLSEWVGSCISDGVYVMKMLKEAGYPIVTSVVSKAEKVGSLAVRTRVYFIAIMAPRAIATTCERVAL